MLSMTCGDWQKPDEWSVFHCGDIFPIPENFGQILMNLLVNYCKFEQSALCQHNRANWLFKSSMNCRMVSSFYVFISNCKSELHSCNILNLQKNPSMIFRIIHQRIWRLPVSLIIVNQNDNVYALASYKIRSSFC